MADDVLLNNAGYGAYGALEAFSMDRIRRQFDTNVLGLMEVTKAVLPHFRQNRSGTVINISSIAGRWVSPGSGWYGASKFALEALSDALRLELKAFGVNVVVVEPGVIATDFANVAAPSIEGALSCSTYGNMMRAVRKSWDAVYRGASQPLEVALTIERALTDPTPSARYLCGHQSASVIASRILPTRLWDSLIRIQMT